MTRAIVGITLAVCLAPWTGTEPGPLERPVSSVSWKPFEAEPGASLPPATEEGLVVLDSRSNFAETVEALERAIEQKGLTLMAKIDHAANARGAGLELQPTTLFVFGNPKVGTPLMNDSRTVAIDLPQKMLVWQTTEGDVKLAYNAPDWLGRRHGLKDEESLEKVAGVLEALAREAAESRSLPGCGLPWDGAPPP